jgi:hypothetical protein
MSLYILLRGYKRKLMDVNRSASVALGFDLDAPYPDASDLHGDQLAIARRTVIP